MESGTFMINSNIDNSVRASVRYTLVHKMMEDNFSKWLSTQSSYDLINKLIEDCKKPHISLVRKNKFIFYFFNISHNC